MAALTLGQCWYRSKKNQAGHEFTNRNIIIPKLFVPLCCQSRNEGKKDIRGGKKVRLLNGFEKLIGKKTQKQKSSNFSPQQKGGDWKDLFLMSISFAVYVYISQKLVCAYCAWNSSMPKHLW